MTRSDQMEQKILIVDLNFSETAFYMVKFHVAFKPENIWHIKSNLHLLSMCLWVCPQTFKASGWWELGKWHFVAGKAAAHPIMKNNFSKLLNTSQRCVSPKRILNFYKY